MSFVEELKRRNVVRVAVLYVVAAWLVLQVVDVLSSMLPVPDWTGSLVFVLLVAGFLPVLVFSWVYELTPEGLKRERDLDRSQSIAHETGRRINLLIVVLLLLVVAIVVADRLIPETAPTEPLETVEREVALPAADATGVPDAGLADAPERSVAVLPFANRSAREDDAYFVDGIHDDIITQLTRIGSLTVISRSSVEAFRHSTLSMKEIGARLGVKAILDGAVQRAGDRVRITAQLVGVETDSHLWAQTYDRKLTSENLFAIQSEISLAIARALEATLLPEVRAQIERPRTDNLEALKAFNLGRQAMARRTSASLAQAERHFRTAIELDPDYARAYVALANTFHLQNDYSGLSGSQRESLARPLIEKALSIDSSLGEAFVARALLGGPDPAAVELDFLTGLRLAPGYASGRLWYGLFLLDAGRPEDALVQLVEAERADPGSAIIKTNVGAASQALGRFTQAREAFEAALDVDPGFAIARDRLAMLAWFTGRLDEAVIEMREALALDPTKAQSRMFLAVIWDVLGDREQADKALAATAAVDTSGFFTAFGTALLEGNRGDLDAARGPAQVVLGFKPEDATMLSILGRSDLLNGRPEVAVARYERAIPSLAETENPVLTSANVTDAINLASLLQVAGETERARRLLERALPVLETMPRLGLHGYWLGDVKVHAMLGQRDLALAAMREAFDEGWVQIAGFILGLDSLKGDPEYEAIVREMEDKLAVQLARVREMESRGELAPVKMPSKSSDTPRRF